MIKKLEYIRLAFTEEPTLIYGSGQWPIQLRRMGYLGFEYVIKDNSILISKMNEQLTIRKKQIEIDKTAKEPTQIQESQKKNVSDSNKQVEPEILESQKKNMDYCAILRFFSPKKYGLLCNTSLFLAFC